jgi:hypothetical protein
MSLLCLRFYWVFKEFPSLAVVPHIAVGVGAWGREERFASCHCQHFELAAF